jgi:hypothetical protein
MTLQSFISPQSYEVNHPQSQASHFLEDMSGWVELSIIYVVPFVLIQIEKSFHIGGSYFANKTFWL